MNKIKILLGYLFSFLLTIIIFLLCLVLILKVNVNKEKVINILENNNYYENVYNEILEEMNNYMVSSGLSGEILNDIFTKERVKNDINNYVNNLYLGKVNVLETKDIEEKLTNNIDNYLKENNLKISNKESINMFKKDITNIYSEEINLYKMLNGFVDNIYEIYNLLDKIIVALAIACFVIFVIILLLKVKYIGSILIANGLMLILSKYLILNNIEVNNITIISDYFSIILRNIVNNIYNNILYFGVFSIVIGLIITLFVSTKANNILKNK